MVVANQKLVSVEEYSFDLLHQNGQSLLFLLNLAVSPENTNLSVKIYCLADLVICLDSATLLLFN